MPGQQRDRRGTCAVGRERACERNGGWRDSGAFAAHSAGGALPVAAAERYACGHSGATLSADGPLAASARFRWWVSMFGLRPAPTELASISITAQTLGDGRVEQW